MGLRRLCGAGSYLHVQLRCLCGYAHTGGKRERCAFFFVEHEMSQVPVISLRLLSRSRFSCGFVSLGLGGWL